MCLYKQALGYGLFEKMKFASMIAFGVATACHRQRSPEGIIGGRPFQLLLQLSAGPMLAAQPPFVKKYFDRMKNIRTFNPKEPIRRYTY